jgi:hypothetical protein
MFSIAGFLLDFLLTGAHHVDLRFSSKEDPQWLKDVRKQEVKIIAKWISQYYYDLAHFSA